MSAQTLFERLSSWPAVSALVGTSVFPSVIPEEVSLPAITFSRIGSPPERTQSGVQFWRRWQVDCWAKDPDTADDMADAVVAALEGFSSARVSGTVVTDVRDDRDPETGDHRRIIECMWLEAANE